MPLVTPRYAYREYLEQRAFLRPALAQCLVGVFVEVGPLAFEFRFPLRQARSLARKPDAFVRIRLLFLGQRSLAFNVSSEDAILSESTFKLDKAMKNFTAFWLRQRLRRELPVAAAACEWHHQVQYQECG